MDFDAFKAIDDACLVFDGCLFIDSTFHTNDCAIRAAGPLTRFSRRYYADQWSHADFNPKEVGQELGSVLLPFFDPTLEPPANPAPDDDRLIPTYKQPKIQGKPSETIQPLEPKQNRYKPEALTMLTCHHTANQLMWKLP